MKKLFASLACLLALASPAIGQKTKAQLNTEVGTNFPDNTTGLITPQILRNTVNDFISSWQQATQVNAQTGTQYTPVIGDYGQLITVSNVSPVAIGLPQAVSPFAPWNAFFRNLGAGTATITPQTSTINGQASFIVPQGEAVAVVSDGVNYQTLGGGNQVLSGSTSANCVAGGLAAVFQYPCANLFVITADTANATSPSNAIIGWQFNQTTSAGIQGARVAVDAILNFSGASSNSSTNRNYVALAGEANMMTADGGTGTSLVTARGAAFGGNLVVRGGASATNFLSVSGLEIDVNWAQPLAQRLGSTVVSFPGSQGVVTDAAFQVGAVAGAGNIGWKNGLLLSSLNGRAPLDTAGCAICSDSSGTIATGLDLSSYTISGNFLKGPGFQVTGAGVTTLASAIHTGVVFASLPSAVAGEIAYVTDGKASNCGDTSCTTFGTTVTAGTGALKLLVWYNGTNWTLIGK